MAENNMLDDFLADNKNAEQIAQQNTAPRPKLKKIKRAKIRPAVDLPTPPEKVAPEPQNTEHSEPDMAEAISTQADGEVEGKSAVNTALMTNNDAQNLVSNQQENSYILDGLPPELDYIMDENLDEEYIDNSHYVKKQLLYVIAAVCLFSGIFIGAIFFNEKVEEKQGLEDVVLNPDVPKGRPRCGLTDKSQACIFYIQNWYKQELNGRDFYKMAAQLTGREEYMIETDNLRYATVKIKPGYFAQLNIPALK